MTHFANYDVMKTKKFHKKRVRNSKDLDFLESLKEHFRIVIVLPKRNNFYNEVTKIYKKHLG